MPGLAAARRLLVWGLLAGTAVGGAGAQTTPSGAARTDSKAAAGKAPAKRKPAANRAKVKRRAANPDGVYMGRRIADVMSWEGADWLFRETRIQEEQPEAMLDALKIPRGAVVADVGAGAGYHSIRLARRVGPKGTVLATDLQPEMLRMLRENARTARVANIKPILASQDDPKLPPDKLDLVLMVDVYHECTDPESMLTSIKQSLKPGGRLVLVEFRGEDPEVPIKPEHKMTLKQVRREVEPAGLVFKDSLEFLPWQHVVVFEKPAPAKPDAKAPEPESKKAAGAGSPR